MKTVLVKDKDGVRTLSQTRFSSRQRFAVWFVFRREEYRATRDSGKMCHKKNQYAQPSAHWEIATLFSKVTYTPVRKHWSFLVRDYRHVLLTTFLLNGAAAPNQEKRGGMPRCGLGGLNKTITACVTAPNRDRLPTITNDNHAIYRYLEIYSLA